jgi:hypothetical protein
MRLPLAIAVIAVSVAMAEGASAQTSDHQRLSVKTEARHQIEACFGALWRAASADMSAAFDASVEYTWLRRWSLCLTMPAEAEFTGGEKAEKWEFRWGDPSASGAYLWRGESFRLQASLGYAYPLEREEKRGYHAFSPSLSLATVRDPVILSVSLDARLCLPREEGGYLLWPPFAGSLSFSAWELLNDRVSYRLSLSPGLSLGVSRVGLGEAPVPRWSLGLAVTFCWDDRNWGLQTGWDGSVDSSAEGGSLSLRGSWRKEWR